MVTVVFQCSSPYVGYTIRIADYQKKEMRECSALQMTDLGWTIFRVSGTYAILMDIENRRYFHARQSDSKAFDEQGRRIYTNVAFVGEPENGRDCRIVTNIALYELFEPDCFYREIADMIRLTDAGFEVDFNRLMVFLERFEGGIQCATEYRQAKDLYDEIMDPDSHEKIRFVVLEATWEYFVRQAGTNFGGSVKRMLSLSEARKYADRTKITVMNVDEESEEPAGSAMNQDSPQTESMEKIEKEERLAELERELTELRGKLIAARTERDRLQAALSRSKFFVVVGTMIGAVLAVMACRIL